jgi:hypothetical protein
MILGALYCLGFVVASKLIPGCKIGNPDFSMWMLILAIGIIVGLFDGCISFVRVRSFSSFIAGPVIHTVLTAVSWYAAKLIPWTRGVDGNPSETGLMLTAIVLGGVVASSISKN